ncbi:hypothetical protein IKQ65_01685 [Candidatus Saccharibacteria bacterium]|nr:hypothetical protein [Candidatus Saccharibacteria bacterium]MBR6961391.1 hypothetical protein [Candidatus Saccharibacteria bacterium]
MNEMLESRDGAQASNPWKILEDVEFDPEGSGLDLEKLRGIWEAEKNNADRRGVNPETGLYEKGRAPVDEENRSQYEKKKMLDEKASSPVGLTIMEKMAAGRDQTIHEWGGYELKKDCCYRKVSREGLEEYKKLGYVGRDPQNVGIARGGKIDTVDWYLGASTSRYGDVLLETPARADRFVPVEKPGANMNTDPDALHMHSSAFFEPIPMSEVKILGELPKE